MKLIFVKLLLPCLRSLVHGLQTGDPYVQTATAATIGLVAAALIVRFFRRRASRELAAYQADFGDWPESREAERAPQSFSSFKP